MDAIQKLLKPGEELQSVKLLYSKKESSKDEKSVRRIPVVDENNNQVWSKTDGFIDTQVKKPFDISSLRKSPVATPRKTLVSSSLRKSLNSSSFRSSTPSLVRKQTPDLRLDRWDSLFPRKDEKKDCWSAVVGEIQDYYRYRDSSTQKRILGKPNYMTTSWPGNLDQIDSIYTPIKRRYFGSTSSLKSLYRNTTLRDRLNISSTKSYSLEERRPARWNSVEERIIPTRAPLPLGGRQSTPLPLEIGGREIDIELTSSERSKEQELGSIGFADLHRRADLLATMLPVRVNTQYGVIALIGIGPGFLEGASWNGPPCHLCGSAINERRCITARDSQFHCWHFLCAFCLKILKENSFWIGDNRRPYCNKICYERTNPKH